MNRAPTSKGCLALGLRSLWASPLVFRKCCRYRTYDLAKRFRNLDLRSGAVSVDFKRVFRLRGGGSCDRRRRDLPGAERTAAGLSWWAAGETGNARWRGLLRRSRGRVEMHFVAVAALKWRVVALLVWIVAAATAAAARKM